MESSVKVQKTNPINSSEPKNPTPQISINKKVSLFAFSSSSSSSSSSSTSSDECDGPDVGYFDESFIDSVEGLDPKYKETFKERQRKIIAKRKDRKQRISDNKVKEEEEGSILKKARYEVNLSGVLLPPGLLNPLQPGRAPAEVHETVPEPESVPVAKSPPVAVVDNARANPVLQSHKQFWKAGDFEGGKESSSPNSFGMDHVRVHPRFLHSNATSHKWALGAFAELLDNSLDEFGNGATYVHIDKLKNKKDNSEMLLVDDNGGGMTPDKMRQCMSLGYSAKSKIANTIGQYGNGFKTSTMRLGADVIVFSSCKGSDGKSPTRSIGMLSYTFLRSTGKDDIVVPMVDYEKRGKNWKKMIRYSPDDWNRNLETILQWSPYISEEDLLRQFKFPEDLATRIVIYNLWEDDQGNSELDFDTDPHDIQIRGVNRDEKNIQMAETYPNCRHFLTYRHSLKSYAAMLYLSLPSKFRIILRGKDVEHHNLVNDMMLPQNIAYRPQQFADVTQNPNVVASGTVGFVKDAESHIDIQGFNVYHKNRLIMPFWRVWNAAGSDGRGVIGILEANFVEPAHDKQGFERTTVLSRLENRLIEIQKKYWRANCQNIGYAARRHTKNPDRESSFSDIEKSSSCLNQNVLGSANRGSRVKSNKNLDNRLLNVDDASEDRSGHRVSLACRDSRHDCKSAGRPDRMAAVENGDGHDVPANKDSKSLTRLKEESHVSMERLLNDLQYERDKCKLLKKELQETRLKMNQIDAEHATLANEVVDERERRDTEEEKLREKLSERDVEAQVLRKRLDDASTTINLLIEKTKQLEKANQFLMAKQLSNVKVEH